MFASVLSAVILGLDVCPVQVEADVSDGLPGFIMVGFPSVQVREAQDRVRTAMHNSGFRLPPKKVTVNLTPADIRKEGAGFDLPVAAAILAASGLLPAKELESIMIYGELGLDGEIHPAAGILPRLLKARELKCRFCIIPRQNMAEALLVPDVRVCGVTSLTEMAACILDPETFIRNQPQPSPFPPESASSAADGGDTASTLQGSPDERQADFSDIHGQTRARRAAEIAAAGFHNLLMIGPPGSGKTMIARRISTILPALTFDEQLELTKIYSIAGLLTEKMPLVKERPFRAPHHTCSPVSLAGGGRIPRPGEITLAHLGVLFLDEMPEFGRHSLEVLRQPLEDRSILISRVGGSCTFPADFMLIAAMNPCPCGFYPDLSRCRCTPGAVSNYLNKISQPLLDRMDLCTEVGQISLEQIRSAQPGESSAVIRARVCRARQIQKERYINESFCCNGQLRGRLVEKYCRADPAAQELLDKAYEKLSFSARSYHRILKTGRTIADLDESEQIRKEHMAEALTYRAFDKRYWE